MGPTSALFAIAYSVVFQTIVAYCMQAWALRFAPASLASMYATAQPIMAALVTCFLLLIGFNPGNALKWPGAEMSGAVFIIAGLLIASYANRFADTAGDVAAGEDDDETSEGDGR